MRVALLAAVLLLAACTDASPTPSTSPAPSADPVRILATDLSLIEEPYTVAVFDNAVDYETAWAQSSRSAAPPNVSFDTEVVVYLGMAGSSSCPDTFEHLVVDADAARVYGEWSNPAMDANTPCTADLAPQGIALAVSRGALPAGEFTLSLRADIMCPNCPDHPAWTRVTVR